MAAFLFPEVLVEVSKAFVACLKTRETAELIKRMTRFRYLMALSCPCQRGSASIAEWLEVAVYRYHGYEFAYRTDREIDLLAMSSLSIEEFAELYKRAIPEIA